MKDCPWDDEHRAALTDVVGYLNFSSGSPDPKFQQQLQRLFERLEACQRSASQADEPTWRRLGAALAEQCQELGRNPGVLGNVDQSAAVIHLVFNHCLPAYWQFHSDLLFHQRQGEIFRPFLIARVCEAVLSSGGPWEEAARVQRDTLVRLNDFVGHRPVAILHSRPRGEPYLHERIRPVPLYLSGAGVACGRYEALVALTLQILRDCNGELLFEACFSPDLLEELAFDPRAYDFDHPVNKRPNYHFGQWDPHHIDNQGRYRRFVWQQIPLDILVDRAHTADGDRGDLLWESAAVLAGTTLMAAYTSGRGPETHDSGVNLSTLLPRIACLRDAFYEQLLARRAGPHGEALRAEAKRLKQPLAGARQHLNQSLARLRAKQQQHTHLARLYANMGYAQASLRQAQIVPVASARMNCEIDCRLVAGHHALDHGDLPGASQCLREARDLLDRAIDCGAVIDPWNILGFQGQFSIFNALENSVRDHRADDLIEQMSRIFSLYARAQSEAAAIGQTEHQQQLSREHHELAQWWDRFAAVEVEGLQAVPGRESAESASQVAAALAAWHQGGAAAGDISFWRRHVVDFHSPKAYALVVRALLDKRDHVAAMALLMNWLSQADAIQLVQEDFSYHELALRWIRQVLSLPVANGFNDDPPRAEPPAIDPAQVWSLVYKYFDYLEANADEYWEAPRLETSAKRPPRPADEQQHEAELDSLFNGDQADAEGGDEDEDDDGNLFRAAYEDVAYRDSTADGHDGSTLEHGSEDTDDLLLNESQRLASRLAFLRTLSRQWRLSCSAIGAQHAAAVDGDVLRGWLTQALENRRRLLAFWEQVQQHQLPAPKGTTDSLVEFERRSRTKQLLLDRIVQTFGETAAAARAILAASVELEIPAELPHWEHRAVELLRAMQRGDLPLVCLGLDRLLEATSDQPLLYLPLGKGGQPVKVANSQALYHVLRELLAGLPRLGLLNETVRLLSTIQELERNHRVGAGAVTEFDHLFRLAFQAVIQCVLESSRDWPKPPGGQKKSGKAEEEQLLGCLQAVTESLLGLWLGHSRLLRLSALERVSGEQRWKALVEFVQRYGGELFTTRFLNWGNLRAIAEQGVEVYLERLEENLIDDERPLLLQDLDKSLPRSEAVELLTVIVEGLLENYVEYRDFNSTTTQSDHGEQLYQLLDFLRLKARYERICWNLQPVVIVHQMLERQGRTAAAARWRQMVADRTGSAADWHQQRLAELAEQHAMRLHTIADRVDERFVRPLSLDRIRALIGPAMHEAAQESPPQAFPQLEREIAEYAKRPCGSGLDTPAWLLQLESDVADVLRNGRVPAIGEPVAHRMPQVRLGLSELKEQIDSWQCGD